MNSASGFRSPVGGLPSGGEGRVFLLLQGPHGPFFNRLGKILRASRAQVWRCGFNVGDEYFWSDKPSYIAYNQPPDQWPAHLARILDEKNVTDIVLYGDVRPVHAAAVKIANERGLNMHVFEEGYLRPYWISYERGGSNGNSALMQISLAEMQAVLNDSPAEIRRPPAHWGDMRHHKFYGAFYHFMLMAANKRYNCYRTHRSISVFQEFRLNLRRLVLSPFSSLYLKFKWRGINRSGRPYSLVLMQLEHDSNFLGHSTFKTNAEFVGAVVAAFAKSAPSHHILIFKAHPLEDGRGGNSSAVRDAATRHGVLDRVYYLSGGKLADLLSQARSVVTVNSTSAQQALWRHLPVKAMGRAIYNKPGIVSDQSLEDFFRQPIAPSPAAYRILRNYLLNTSQVPGGFYSERSRSHALRIVSDMLLASEDPYSLLASGNVAVRQQVSEFDV